MKKSNDEAISTLNGLIQTCKDGEEGFRDASDGVQSGSLRTTLGEYARQRAKFAGELQAEVIRLGGDPERSGTVAGSLHRGWINLKSAIGGKDDHAILGECERGEDAAVKNYEPALNIELPQDLRSIVERQYSEILSAHDQIKAFRDSTGKAGDFAAAGSSPAKR